MSAIKDLLNSVLSGDADQANAIFGEIMQEKQMSAIEDARLEMAQSMFNEGKSEYEKGKEEVESEDDNESDDEESDDDKSDDEKSDSDSDEKDDESSDDDADEKGDVKTKKSGKKVTITVDEETEQIDEFVSPFKFHPANVAMKAAGIADNDSLPPPANFVTSIAKRLVKRSTNSAPDATEKLDNLGGKGDSCDSGSGACGAVKSFANALSKKHYDNPAARNNPYLKHQYEETEQVEETLDEAETTYTSSTGRIQATMEPGKPGVAIKPAPKKDSALKLKMSDTLAK